MISLGFACYIASLFLFLLGLYAMIAKKNIIRKIIGMVILQTSVILFFLSLSFKEGSKFPIVEGKKIVAENFANPLPHALMLTAIVVGVSLLGMALVLAVSLYKSFQTLNEDEILEKLK